MAISPPSDIVLDVVRAADPAAVREAHQTLMAQAGKGASAAAASEAFDRSFGAARLAGDLSNAAQGADRDEQALRDSYQKFEAMVLQSFVKSMLPSDNEEFFGKGTAGEIWKGMMAEQLGTMISKGGGIGIAEHMMGEGVTLAASDRPMSAGMTGNDLNRATGLLQALQTDTLKDWLDGGADAADPTAPTEA